MDPEHAEQLFELEKVLHYEFLNLDLLSRALTHSSCRNHLTYSNERLEFLGDAVLGFVVTDHLYRAIPDEAEGELTRIKSIVVSRASLAKLGRSLGVGKYLILGKGLTRKKSLPRSLLANAFEAILGAIYLDGGLEEARAFTLRMLEAPIQEAIAERHGTNCKSLLQQYAQRRMGQTPSYRVAAEEGPDHGKRFTVVSIIGEKEYGRGSGATKKEAEQNSAAATLTLLGVNPATGRGPEEEPEAPNATQPPQDAPCGASEPQGPDSSEKPRTETGSVS